MYDSQEYANVIARRIGLLIFGVSMVITIFAIGGQVPAFHWWLTCLMIALSAHSVAYAYIFANNVDRYYQPPPLPPDDYEPPDDSDSKTVQATGARSQAAVSSNDPTALWLNGWMRTRGASMVRIPDNVDPNHLIAIYDAVATGRLHDGLSPNRLDAEKIVSRHTEEPNAYTAVGFMVQAGLLQDNGERKMYTWTKLGKRVFNLPHPDQGQNRPFISRVPGVTRLNTTATTEYTEVGHV